MGRNIVVKQSSLEAGWQGEVGLAATRSGITRDKANEIALKLLPL